MAFKFSLPFGKKEHNLDSALTLSPVRPVSGRKKKRKSADNERRKAQGFEGKIALLLLLFVITFGLVYHSNISSKEGMAYVSAASDLRMLSQRLAKSSAMAVQGDANSIDQLKQASNDFSNLLTVLKQGGMIGSVEVSESPDDMLGTLNTLNEQWDRSKKSVALLTQQEAALAAFKKNTTAVNENDASFQELGARLVALQTSDTGRASAVASQLWMLTQSIAKNVNYLQGSDIIRPDVSLALFNNMTDFETLLDEMGKMGSAESRALARDLGNVFSANQEVISGIMASLHHLEQAKQAGSNIFLESNTLYGEANKLYDAYQKKLDSRGWHVIVIAVLSFLMLGLLGWVGVDYIRESYGRAEEADLQRQASDSTNRQNQEAILRLMNELGDLADGDLTVTATVSEDITGAIADSINYTIEELRVLVGRINDASTRVTQATEVARKTSTELLAAAAKQGEEINLAGNSVLAMAESMQAVSGHAAQSAQVARSSLEAADKGTTAVQDSIRSMNEIREQIQDTAKRIKRLGESSQEIGEIVELISDITEQTNVLALNAAIQAASAGEAGRGFTVVAEEVQRLAERSAEATKQISALVKTIQTDTQDAVSAMEQSTQGVVEGAKRSDTAGQALAEIGQVSRDLAALIENISGATQEQSHSATQVAKLMQDILHITRQTTVSTNHTARAVDELNALASELKGSVAGFKVS
ncbi:MAG: methyl-accepting chemotaxis protein [Betaproteobacteria bacterium]|nr:methyl-accepting chemotaxis protein [Betaproteobacteria bacterium]